MPPGQVENEMLLVRRKYVKAPIAAFWIKGSWVYPPHWDDYPGEEATHWKRHSKDGTRPKNVDVAMSVYGKPYQTAVTLASLLEHSGAHIDKIYFQEEIEQPHGDDVSWILDYFSDRGIIRYRSEYYLGFSRADRERLADQAYRHSIRYQYAWENTDKRFLFIMHNDCLFGSDIVGGMLEKLADEVYAGVGMIGQCWNCPASFAQLCDGDRYENFKPDYEQVLNLIRAYPSPRTTAAEIDAAAPVPLPECRLNEFACLITVDMLRQHVVPEGDVVPFGMMGLDLGTEWFKSLTLRGYRFLNWHHGLTHSPFASRGIGHDADNSHDEYTRSEHGAKEFLKENHPSVYDDLQAILASAVAAV
jgi:hypothetical protein